MNLRMAHVGAWGWSAVVVAAAVFAPRPAVDNSVDALMASDAPAVQTYRRFLDRFGTDEVVVARIEGPRALDVFRFVDTVTSTLAANPSMRGVLSVTALHPETTTVVLDEVFGGPASLAENAEALRSPLVRRLALWSPSEPGRPTTANVYGLATVSPVATRAALENRLTALKRTAADAGVRIAFAGPPLLNLALDRAGRQTETYALPLLLGVTIALLLVLTGRLTTTIALILPVGLTVLGVDGAFGALGGVTNILVNVAKPLLLVIGLASAVHVYFEYRQRAAGGVPIGKAPWVAARSKAVPVLLALMTTAVGFGSLALSTVAPIRAFGLVAGFGLVAMAPTVLLTVPFGLWLLQRHRPPSAPLWPERAATELAEHLVRGSLRRPYLGPALGLVIVLAGAAALPALAPEPHAIRYFAPHHPLRSDHRALEAAGLGLATVEVIVAHPGLTADPDAVSPLTAFARAAAEHPAVAATVGWPHLVAEARSTTGRPRVDGWLLGKLRDRPAAAAFGDDDHARIALLVRTVAAPEIARLKAHVLRCAQQTLPETYDVDVTGNYDLLLHAQSALLQTLRSSLFWTALLMELALIVVLRSVWLGVVTLLPNLLPVAINLLAMVALGIPLDLGTSMTAAIALGIAVDDTLHFTLTARAAPLTTAARSAGAAIVVSSWVIGMGFAALLTTTFLPTRRFGGLCALAMASALLADLFVLPPLLKWAREPRHH